MEDDEEDVDVDKEKKTQQSRANYNIRKIKYQITFCGNWGICSTVLICCSNQAKLEAGRGLKTLRCWENDTELSVMLHLYAM